MLIRYRGHQNARTAKQAQKRIFHRAGSFDRTSCERRVRIEITYCKGMTKMLKRTLSRSVSLILSGSAVLGAGMLVLPVLAQAQQSGDTGSSSSTSSSSGTTTTTQVQRVEITGTNIRRADTETPSPVQIITAADMKKSGYTNVADVLQNITANGQGTLSASVGDSFANGASGMSLRGLNTGATLTLIDGHRMAPYPLADNAQYAFVDISNLPFDAIDRVEILKDGASAVYGSDAIAGVVNIILKKTFNGTSVNVDGGKTQEGGAANVHASIMTGFGDLNEDGYNGYVSFEVKHDNEISWASRANTGPWASKNFTSSGGVNYLPGVENAANPNPPVTASPYLYDPVSGNVYFPPNATCNANAVFSATGCPWNQHSQLIPETQHINFLASFTKRLDDGWELNVKASVFDAKTWQVGDRPSFPTASIPGVNVGILLNPANPQGAVSPGATYFPINLPATYPGNGLGVPAQLYGTDLGAPIGETLVDSKAIRLVADLNGSIGDWEIKTSLGYTRVNAAQTTTGSLYNMNLTAFNNAINRTVNPFNIFSNNNSASDLASIFPSQYSNGLSTLEFGEAHANHPIIPMAGGDAMFSTGLEFTHRELYQTPPPDQFYGLIDGGSPYAIGAQNVASEYTEFFLPVLKSLELDFDQRFDHVDTTGNALTGKAAFKWSPVNSFSLRGAMSSGYRAPNINEAGTSGTTAGSTPTFDPVLCPGGPTAAGNPPLNSVPAFCNYDPILLTTGNSKLQPERSTSFTLGAIIEPIAGWSTTIDMYKITIRNQIISPTPDYATQSPVYSTVAVPAAVIAPQGCGDGNGNFVTCPQAAYNQPLWYTSPFVNANSTMTDGFEIGSKYRFRLGDWGKFTTDLDWTHVMSYVLTSGGVAYQLAGSHGPSAASNDTGNPQDRIDLTLGWDQGPLNITTTLNWIGRYSVLDSSAQITDCATASEQWYAGVMPPENYCHVASFLNTNLSATYQINKQWTVTAAIENIFNRQPPVDLQTYGNNYVATNMSFYGAGVLGRSFHVGTTYLF
jgi:iron complex outermembrane receptor protein